MALESSHRDLFLDLGCDGWARYSIASIIVLNKVFLVIKELIEYYNNRNAITGTPLTT